MTSQEVMLLSGSVQDAPLEPEPVQDLLWREAHPQLRAAPMDLALHWRLDACTYVVVLTHLPYIYKAIFPPFSPLEYQGHQRLLVPEEVQVEHFLPDATDRVSKVGFEMLVFWQKGHDVKMWYGTVHLLCVHTSTRPDFGNKFRSKACNETCP